ncbi:hypothetical protein AX17_000023 [Amanita inopinata Kibby_2008]|nr:hypothetical protein AX17_000023 [Amanita inopinata Kibby_2008]
MDDISEAEVTEQCKLLQQEEFEVLESIYPECITNELSHGLLKLEVPVELGEAYMVRIYQDGMLGKARTDTLPEPQEASLSTLPPIILNIILPPLYPLLKPPELVSIRAMHLWLSEISQLYKLLDNMWQPGNVILYNWIEFLRTGDFLAAMELKGPGAIQCVLAERIAPSFTLRRRLFHPAPHVLSSSLKSFETSTKTMQFANSSYLCSICFTSYKGSKCLQLSCDHIFCRSCLADYWKLSIAEGDVGKVGCADPDCVKAGKEAAENEVARVVTDDEVKRWRSNGAPVRRPAVDEGEQSGWERFRQCEACGFSFCVFCKRTWHGPHTACLIAHAEKLVLEYLAAEEGTEERAAIERRYGHANVQRLMKRYEEERANQEWIKSSTTACPRCEVAVQKSLGCNHVGGVQKATLDRLKWIWIDDMRQMWAAFLLPLRGKAVSGESVWAFLDAGAVVLLQIV